MTTLFRLINEESYNEIITAFQGFIDTFKKGENPVVN
jgi:hypothetical protein